MQLFHPHFRRVSNVFHSETHSGRRWRAIGLTVATSMGDRVVSNLCALAQVPLALHYLGQEAFGLWMTLAGVIMAMNVTDLGLGVGLQNKLSEALGHDDMDSAQRVHATGTIMLGLLGLAVFVLFIPFCHLVDWGAIFKVHDPETRRNTGAALAIMLFYFCCGLPATTGYRLAIAFQLGWMQGFKNSATGVLTLALVALAVYWKLSFLSFITFVVMPPALTNFILFIILYRRFGWSLRIQRRFDWTLGKSLFKANWLFVVPQIGGTILAFAPALIISSMLGAVALTPYNLIQKLLGLFSQIQGMLIAPFWPAYSEAKARGDFGWIKATFKKSILISGVFTVLPLLSFILWGRFALHLWTREPSEAFSQLLLVSLSVWTAVSAFSQPAAILLNALGRIKGQSIYGSVSIILALCLMPTSVSHLGISGIPLSLLVSFSLINTPLAFLESFFNLKSSNSTTCLRAQIAYNKS